MTPEADTAPPPTPAASGTPVRALLQPLRLGPRTAPNRIVFGPHPTNFGVGNGYTARHRAYYAARAAGGTGLLVAEALTVHPQDWPYEHVPFGHTDAILPSLRELLGAVRAANGETLLLAGLNHHGGQTSGKLLRQSPWAPSATVDVASKRMARAMLPGEIAQVVAGYGAAAGRVSTAGLDGVELSAGQNSLLRQFLSPLSNFRGDEYGGSLENRLRLVTEVLRTVRGALGAERVLGLKLVGDELAPWGGLTPEQCQEIAQVLVALGLLDYLSIQTGGPYSGSITDAGMPTEQGHAAHLAAGVRQALGGALPVFAEGRIESAALAQRLLAEQQADACVMTRALISDPDLPRKAAGQDAAPIRPHMGMQRYFLVVADWNRPLGDLANPRAGREALLPPVRHQPREAPALVIGGGPAGMEAALTLAQQGHAVTLLERGAELGGWAAHLAAQVPARAEFALLVEWYAEMLARHGVQVRLNTDADAALPGLADYGAVYLATGSDMPAPTLPNTGGTLLGARDLFRAEQAVLPPPEEGRAVVLDTECGFRMGNAVEWLLDRGYGVDVVTPDFFVGRDLVESAEMLWFGRVAGQGAVFHPRTKALRLEQRRLLLADRFSGRERPLDPVALVVQVQPEAPGDALYEALCAVHPRVLRIGDQKAPRLMGEAILNAHRTVVLQDGEGAAPGH